MLLTHPVHVVDGQQVFSGEPIQYGIEVAVEASMVHLIGKLLRIHARHASDDLVLLREIRQGMEQVALPATSRPGHQ